MLNNIKYPVKNRSTLNCNNALTVVFLIIFSTAGFYCQSPTNDIASTSISIKPEYRDITLTVSSDTLHFPLSANTYNEIKSFNYFIENNKTFMSFYDRRSQSVVIYDFNSGKRIKKLRLKKYFKEPELKSICVYTNNFDSIFISSINKVYLLDTAGAIRQQLNFFDRIDTRSVFDNTLPLIVKNNVLYTGVKNTIDETSLSDIRKWKLIYEFNGQSDLPKLLYSLPVIYSKNLYGYRFLDYSYCYNDKGNFVFSFPADASVYETDLNSFQNVYLAKSRFQTHPILPVSREALENNEGYKQYVSRDSYGAIYYDSYRQRYLRLAKQGVDEHHINDSQLKRKQSVIMLDKSFKVIAETEINNTDFYFDSIFYTSDGSMYARTKLKDENALHFVRLEYREGTNELAQSK